MDTDKEDLTMLSAAAAAAILGLHPKTVVRWCRIGKLRGAVQPYESRRIGWQIPKAEVERMRRLGGNGGEWPPRGHD